LLVLAVDVFDKSGHLVSFALSVDFG